MRETDIPEIVNVEAARGWETESAHWVEHDDRYNATSRRHDIRLREAARIAATDRVLDIGCGTGESTRNAARIAAAGEALGVDISRRMIERARERGAAEGLTNVRFEVADAQVYPFEEAAFDVVISRFGAMFFGDPAAAFRNIGSAVRPNGRLVLLAWQELIKNEWLTAIREALAAGRALGTPPAGSPGPFGLADRESVHAILIGAGFGDIEFGDIQEPMRFGSDTEDAFAFMRSLGITRGLLDGLEPATATRALEQLRSTLAQHETGEGVLLGSRAWLITARRAG